MEISVKKLENLRVEIVFKVPKEEFEKFREKAILKLGQDLKIEGFRPGKAPREVVERGVGEVKILEEATRQLVEESYPKAILENKIEPIAQPEIEVLKSEDPSNNFFSFKASLFILPEIRLPDYKKVASQIKRNKVLIEETEIENALRWIQKSRAKFSLKAEPCEKSDFIEIEFSSPQIDSGLKRKDAFILGDGHFLPDFEENLVGMKNSQEKNFSLKFPENYFKKDIAGKDVEFKVKINSVQKMELPEMSDEWAKSFGNFNDLISLRNSLKEGVIKEKEIAESQRVRQEILEKLSDNSKFEIPEVLIEREKEVILGELKEKVSSSLNIKFEEYLDKIKKTEKEIRDTFSEEAKKKAKYDLILREISLKEKIEVSDEEIKKEITHIFQNQADEKIKELDLENLKLYIKSEIRKIKTLNFLESLSK